jgi:hypothetical protein
MSQTLLSGQGATEDHQIVYMLTLSLLDISTDSLLLGKKVVSFVVLQKNSSELANPAGLNSFLSVGKKGMK